MSLLAYSGLSVHNFFAERNFICSLCNVMKENPEENMVKILDEYPIMSKYIKDFSKADFCEANGIC